MESVGFIKRNQTVMQIGMGGGMKAGVNMWRALRDVQDHHAAWSHLQGNPITGVCAAGPQACRAVLCCLIQASVLSC